MVCVYFVTGNILDLCSEGRYCIASQAVHYNMKLSPGTKDSQCLTCKICRSRIWRIICQHTHGHVQPNLRYLAPPAVKYSKSLTYKCSNFELSQEDCVTVSFSAYKQIQFMNNSPRTELVCKLGNYCIAM